MIEAQKCFEMARKAAEEKAHVASVVFNGLAALLAPDVDDARAGVDALISCSNIPKKPEDQRAGYYLAIYVAIVRGFGDYQARLNQLIEDIGGKQDAASP